MSQQFFFLDFRPHIRRGHPLLTLRHDDNDLHVVFKLIAHYLSDIQFAYASSFPVRIYRVALHGIGWCWCQIEIHAHEEVVQTLCCGSVYNLWIFEASTSCSSFGIYNSGQTSLSIIPEVFIILFDMVLCLVLVGASVVKVLLDFVEVTFASLQFVFLKSMCLFALWHVVIPSIGSFSCLVGPYLGCSLQISIFETHLPPLSWQHYHQWVLTLVSQSPDPCKIL